MIRPIYLMREQDDGDSVRDEADPDKDFVSEPPPESGPWSDHELGASLGVDAGAEPEAQPGAVARGLSKRPSRAPTRSSPRFASMSDDGNAADSMLARLQLRDRFDEAEQAAEKAADDADGAADAADPDDATPDASAAGEGPTAGSSPVPSDASSRARVSAHVMSPHGPIHKSTWNIHLLTAKSRGEKLTPCRVGRAAQAAKLACLEQASNSAFASGGTLGRAPRNRRLLYLPSREARGRLLCAMWPHLRNLRQQGPRTDKASGLCRPCGEEDRRPVVRTSRRNGPLILILRRR